MRKDFVLSLSSLAVGYQGKPLIRDISVQLKRGMILTLIGPNGAGKSTLLKTITRQLAPVAGTVFIGDRDVFETRPAELAKRMAVVLTERVSPEMMTCFDVAAMGRYPYTGRFGALTEKDRALVSASLSRVRAEDIAQRDFSQISDGQRQRVLLARALCQEPEILVLDEPTSFLDIRHKIELLDILLSESREKGLTVVLSLHEIDLAEKISDLVMCVKGDAIRLMGPPETVFTDENIARLYDLSQGSYLVKKGSVELARPEGAPRVFVLGGAGRGLPHYRALQKKRVPFLAGILYENDLEYETARALACQVISAPPFQPIPEDAMKQAQKVILSCEAVLDAASGNPAHASLLSFARENHLKVVKHADELD